MADSKNGIPYGIHSAKLLVFSVKDWLLPEYSGIVTALAKRTYRYLRVPRCCPWLLMLQELKFQLSTAVLTVLTIAAGIAAALNYQQIHRFRLPDDGVVWADRLGPKGHKPFLLYA